jgi:DNA polymerase-1
MESSPLPPHPVLFLIDGYALVYRAFFALLSRPLTTSRGENTSAAWGVVNFLERLLERYRPDYIAWIHDSGLSFRHEVYSEYKATREKLGAELQADFDTGLERIEQLLAAYRIPLLTVPGYEADDVIGTLALKALQRGVNVVIVSGDKDFQQLVRPGIWLLNPGRGGPAGIEEQWIAAENAAQRFGVPAERVTDFLALVGDTSDNVPGVPGIGEKTARELVARYGDLESILAHAAEVPNKRVRESLLAYAEEARLSKRLVTIRNDVPVELDLEAWRVREPDKARLRQLFLELEFTSLLRRLDDARQSRPARLGGHYATVTPATLESVLAKVRCAKEVALDVETIPEPGAPLPYDPLRSQLVGLAVALAPGEAYYFPFLHSSASHGSQPELAGPSTRSAATNLPALTSEPLRPLKELIENPAVAKVLHDAKFGLLVLRRHGVQQGGLAFDTMLASYVLDPGRRSHALDLLAIEFLQCAKTSSESLLGKGRQQRSFADVPLQEAASYACENSDLVLQLRLALSAQLESQGLLSLFSEIEMPLVEVLADMEEAGICIDLPWFRSLKERFQAERKRVEQAIYAEAGEDFNVNSNQQVRTILFDKLKLPVRKRTATGPSTDATVLQELADEGHVLPALLLEYRELAKLESTYLDTLPKLVHPSDGRLHTSFNQTVAATGRLSSSEPNLQNIPIRRELGRAIRRGFVAPAGSKLLVADYSQIELRILAHLSQDPVFLEVFARGGDIHRETAAAIFGVPVELVTPQMRSQAKTINFATIYGQGAPALARQLKIPVAEARAFIATYFERFKGVRSYLDSQIALARERGFVETIFKRRRYIPELRDPNYNIRAFGERVATNAPIQGSAADLIKVAMIRIHRGFREERHSARMILQVHDELVFEVPDPEVSRAAQLVRHDMEHAAELSVPILVDIGVGQNWLDAKG